MLKAVLRQGAIIPLEPLPNDWAEGVQLEIDLAKESKPTAPFDIDLWAREMKQLCADSSVDDEQVMRQAIEQHREQAKAQARREMGLSV